MSYPIKKIQSEIEKYIDSVIEGVKEGEVNALDAHIFFNVVKKSVDRLKYEIHEELIEEAEKYDGQTYHGYRVEVVKGRRKYSFDHIPQWSELDKRIKALETVAKQARQQADGAKMIVSDDGEVAQAAKVTYGKSYVKISKPKTQ